MHPTPPQDGTQAVVGSIKALLRIASEAFDTAATLATLLDPVEGERITNLHVDLARIRSTWNER